MQKFPKVKYPNDSETDGLTAKDVVVTEKLDGANFRWTWDDDGTLRVGTRNHEYTADDENLPHSFQHAVDYIQQHCSGSDMANTAHGYTYYGEAMHKHSLDYSGIDWEQPHKGSPHVPLDSDQPNVVLFDVRGRDGEWLSWDMVDSIADELAIPLAPVVERGSDLDFEVPDESMFGGEPEGIMIRREDGAVRAKKVTESFREKKGGSPSSTNQSASDAAEFVYRYVTDARIEKQAHKLVDEGEYDSVCMDMMEHLPRRVLLDVMAEEGWTLLNGDFETEWNDDFKGEVRSKASGKCADVLKSMLQDI